MPLRIRRLLGLDPMPTLFKSIVLPLAWTICVFYLLSFDTSGVDGLTSIWKIYGIDKPIHFGIFFLLAYLWTHWLVQRFNRSTSKILFTLIAACSLFGMGMEYYQLYFTNRSFSYWDGVADAIGSVAGCWMAIKKPPWK